MIAKFTFNYNGGFEKKENAVFQQGSIGVDSYQVFAPFLTTTQVYIKTKRNGDLEFSLWKQLDYNSTIGGWLKTATQDELLVDGEMKVVFKFNNLVSQETSLWVRKGTLIVPEMTTYEALRDYVESIDGRIDQLLAGETAFHHVQFDNTLVDGDVTDKPSIMYDSYEKMFRAINDDDTDIVIGGELQKLVRNENSGDLAEGTIVSISGAVGQRVTIDKFDITSESEHARIPAVITKTGVIALHGLGKVSFFGEIKGLPIANFEVTGTAYAEGQPLYCSINSKITNVAPAKPNLHVHIGTLERIVGTTANVFIHTLVIPHFSHLSDVEITTPQEGDIYVKTGSKVMNSQRLVIAESEITKIKDGTTIVKKAEQDKNSNDIVATYETKSDATSKKSELDGEILVLDGRVEDLETANMIKSYTYNPSTHVLTFTYYDNTTTSFDLPLESAIVSASYDNVTKDITFTLQSGATLVVPLDDLISGLASETWVTTYFIPKTALKTSFSATPSDTNVISEKLAKDTFDTKEELYNKQFAHRYIKSLGNRLSVELPTSIQIMGDSTGNGENEWVYLFTQWLATNVPNYSVKYRLWNDTTQSFLFPKQMSVAQNGNGYIQISSTGGNYMRTPDNSKLDLSGDLEIVAHISCDSYTQTQTVVNKFGSSGNRGFSFGIDANKLTFWWSSDGVANTYKTSTTTMPSTNGQDIWVRVVFDADNGSSGNTIKFYTSENGNTWTQLGSDVVTAGVATIFNNSEFLVIGSRNGVETLVGKIYEVYVKNENGETVCSPDFGMLQPYGTITLKDLEGNTWQSIGTITKGGSPSLHVVNSSQSGSNISYFTDDTRFAKLTNTEAQMYIVNLCHNQSNNVDYIPIYETLFDKVKTKYTNAYMVAMTQNPQLPPEVNIIPHAIRNNQITIYSVTKNYMLIDIYRAFINYGDYSVLIADGVHPNDNGNILWKNEVVKNFIGMLNG